MKINVQYDIEAKEIPEMISGIISNMAQFYEMYTHIEKTETSKQTGNTYKSPLCEYYIDTQTHTVYRIEDLIFKLVKEGKIQPDLTK